MRDKRQPTPVNVTTGPRSGGSEAAEEVPKLFASRLRAARQVAGLSQDALAKAMNERGFSWRQTTVAKTEAAVRPVLFAEAIALAAIFRMRVESFVSPVTPLDEVVGGMRADSERLQNDIAEFEMQIQYTKQVLRNYSCSIELGAAMIEFRSSLDSGPLRRAVESAFQRYGAMCLEAVGVFDAVEVTGEELDQVDHVAVTEAIRAYLLTIDELSVSELVERESGEMLAQMHRYLDGQEVDGEFLHFIRDFDEWKSTATVLLMDILVERVPTVDAYSHG
jgi:transcriptional regulator with XRE-family HTH domain